MAPRKKLAHRILGLCVQYAQPLSFILYLSAAAGFLLLPHAAKRNYLDENALLAGFANSQIRYSASVSKVLNAFGDNGQNNKQPLEAAHQAMHNMQLPHWMQHGSCGSMLHTMLAATRTDGKEAIAFVTPVSANNTAPSGSYAAIKLMASLLHYLSQVQWLAKDIIWLLVENECSLGQLSRASQCSAQQDAKAWLELWHGKDTQNQVELEHSSVIQQALILELHSASFNALHLEIVGWNGQLPQLDLYFLVKRLAEMGSGLQVTQAAPPAWIRQLPSQMHSYMHALLSLTAFSWQQATRQPSGIHAEFLRHGIDSLTIHAVQDARQGSWSFGSDESATKLLVLLELVVRSLNNLLERFHHSTVFYLLLSPDWHIPFQAYIVPPILLIAILVLQAADSSKDTSTSSRSQASHQPQSWLAAVMSVIAAQLAYFAALAVCSALCSSTRLAKSTLSVAVLCKFMSAVPLLICCCVASRSNAGCCRGYVRTTALAFVAAGACVLLCLDWACAFFVMVLVVPMAWLEPHVGIKPMLFCAIPLHLMLYLVAAG